MNDNNSDMDLNCKRCQKPATNGLKCIICGKVSHKSCIKILQNSKQQSIKVIDNDKLVCCIDQSSSGAAELPNVSVTNMDTFVEGPEDLVKMKIKYLEEIIRQKDLIILNQEIAIKSLSEQIVLLKQVKATENASMPLHHKPANQKIPTLTPTEKSAAATSSYAKHTFDTSSVSTAIHNALAVRTCDDIINLTKELPDETKPSKSANKVKPKNRNILIGSKVCTNDCPLKAATVFSMHHFHLTNVHSAVTENDLLQYLQQFASDVKVLKLNSRHPNIYSSFKISIPSSQAQSILSSEIWPEGVALNQFFQSRRQHAHTDKEEHI